MALPPLISNAAASGRAWWRLSTTGGICSCAWPTCINTTKRLPVDRSYSPWGRHEDLTRRPDDTDQHPPLCKTGHHSSGAHALGGLSRLTQIHSRAVDRHRPHHARLEARVCEIPWRTGWATGPQAGRKTGDVRAQLLSRMKSGLRTIAL